MARRVGIFLLVLAAARAALSADTGMLYVKSDPPGAAVLIDGKERGKTPVLVKDLPAGETKIELRIEGAKPVTVLKTVEANRVTTVSADIDVPAASITIISDPLEATVYLDRKEHGKTPLTIEGLLPGRHELLLMKTGSPNTTRSIVLAAGEERVLEVKLGTAGKDEEARPAAASTSRVPVAMAEFFDKFLALVDKDDHAGAQRLAERASAERNLAGLRAHVLAAAEAAKLLEGLAEAAKRGAKTLVGQEVELVTKTGTRVGRVEAVDDEGIALIKEIKVGRQVVGGSASRVAWGDLTPEALEKLAGDWPPEGTAGAVARALAARARGDVEGTRRALDDAGDDLLGQYLSGTLAAAAEAATTAEARAAWEEIEKRTRASKLSCAAAQKLLADIEGFKARHAKSGLAVPSSEQMREAEDRARTALVRAAGVPREAVEFNGHSYMLYDVTTSWPEAKRLCEQANGHLVTLTSWEEHRFVLGMCQGRAKVVWIGLTDGRQEGRWEWVTGEKFDFTAWAPGEPNDAGSEDFGELAVETPDRVYLTSRWNDGGLQARNFFVCEWEFATGIR